uniref:Uncharacterized protein n=1 Tax=Arundo donax TaxID=35708 RepID=A0A0A8Y749_ARUDO
MSHLPSTGCMPKHASVSNKCAKNLATFINPFVSRR